MAEGGALLRHCASNRTEGSNPSLSAILYYLYSTRSTVSHSSPFIPACRAIRVPEDSLNLLNEHLSCIQLGEILCCEFLGPDRPSLQHHIHLKTKLPRAKITLKSLLFFGCFGDAADYAV